jgi:hypothetical protein
MLELFVGSDLVRRQMKGALEPTRRPAVKAEPRRGKRVAVRATSAAALRSLADRLEPSPG